MKKTYMAISLFLVLLGLAACGPVTGSGQESSNPAVSQPLPVQIEATVDIHCTDIDPHPIGQGIAETYDVPYEQVMAWFCEGFSFDNILVALETSEAVDIPAETLLQKLLEKDWEEIWNEVGFPPED